MKAGRHVSREADDGPSCERPSPWTYDESRAALRSAVPAGINPSLTTITALCEALGDPQERYPVIQVAGTNGKTSASRMIAAILAAHGLSVGLYTSPDLGRPNERIEMRGAVISDDDFALAVGTAADTSAALAAEGEVETATEFELLTAAALHHFAQGRAADVVVLEVGLGGRWDATSVATPAVAVITGVGIDHAELLGVTRERIAAEKAQTIKPMSVAVLGPGTRGVEDVFCDRADEVGARVRAVCAEGGPSPCSAGETVRYAIVSCANAPRARTVVDVQGLEAFYPGLEVVGPRYQAANVATSVAAAEAFLRGASDPQAFRLAFRDLHIPGRFDVVCDSPTVIIDTAHNPEGAETLADAIEAAFGSDAPTVVLGVLADKDVRGIVEALVPVAAEIVVTSPASVRALEADGLAHVVEDVTGVRPASYGTVSKALESVMAAKPSGVVVAGSAVTAGEALALIRESFC